MNASVDSLKPSEPNDVVDAVLPHNVSTRLEGATCTRNAMGNLRLNSHFTSKATTSNPIRCPTPRNLPIQINQRLSIIQRTYDLKIERTTDNIPSSHHHTIYPAAAMSFFGIGRQQPTSEQKLAAVEGEMRMMADTYNRLQKTCQKKCISTDYREAELNKGESVCLDRCTAKFLDTSMKVSEIMQQQGQAMGGGAAGGNGGAFS
ncbi:hypothetical protein E4U37_000910 [Claviceps purpurea]|nr:hypothetical protein E4U37_000910 [Claviceps purpurea]